MAARHSPFKFVPCSRFFNIDLMITIHLHSMIFHSFHGMFKEEKVLGNDFEVNMDVVIDAPNPILKLHQSVDYVTLHAIIREVMDEPTPLLETVVQALADRVGHFDQKIKAVTVSVKKLNPPISNFQGTVGITCSKTFH